ncbi:hypothetical protein J416_14722 [Gracilibacillus halophilus YIM-C55.5]|uniref:PucR C-terminal helix-turn-helix domain-containing protein n=1 Tax=Gracilibacillus halophilus YIM-C55.5 TaxID=1308866 RepID=N4W907_9BACI|nr:helix-turn-helix domain-containing protein [Gracilibacillus halophilus]ENH95719.1 hypothetical protein J416_14722 [Gracilibacillus halophilus YIM-C55.5]
MEQNLEQLFPNMMKGHTDDLEDAKAYQWYLTNNQELIGIPIQDLSSREEALLRTFLTPYDANIPPTTEREKMWNDVLFHQKIPKTFIDQPLDGFYFVYFSISEKDIDPDSFREAIGALFPKRTPILWESNQEGVIIHEGEKMTNQAVSYQEIIEVLTTDFYMNIQLFVGPTLHDIQQASDYYHWVRNCFRQTRTVNRGVMDYVEAVPYLFLHSMTHEEKQLLVSAILNPVKDDDELLKTVQVFLEANSNTTLAAKKMYMHRNSLQYRVDKFIEKTGIDVKQFEGALAVYLCLIMHMNR